MSYFWERHGHRVCIFHSPSAFVAQIVEGDNVSIAVLTTGPQSSLAPVPADGNVPGGN